MKTWKQGFIGFLAVIALVFAFIACDDGNGDKDPPADNATVTINEKTITVDYSQSGITKSEQAKADAITPKLQEAFNKTWGDIIGDNELESMFNTMVNRPNFKIIIIPGNSGCARNGDNMTLGADFLHTASSENIGNNMIDAIYAEGIFAD